MATTKNDQKPLWRITSRERQFILLLGDILTVSISLLLSLYFWAQGDQWLEFNWQFLSERPPDWFYFLPVIWLTLLIELYETRRASRVKDTVRGIAVAAAISTILYLFVFFISEPKSLPRRGVAVFIASASIWSMIWRLIYIRIFTAPAFLRRVLTIGAGRAGTELVRLIQKISPEPFSLIGFIDDDEKKVGKKILNLPVIGCTKDMRKIIEEQQITDLIFAISGDMNPELNGAVLEAEELGIEVTTMPAVYEELFGRVPVSLLVDDWLLRNFLDRSHAPGSYELLKRLFDTLGAVIGIVLLIPVFPLIALAILLDDGFPIVFKQTRIGEHGKQFQLLKFRSMDRDAEKDGVARFAVENDDRVTRIGKFLRRSHLDELPQFINVIKGDLSIVGPRAERPELVDFLKRRVPFYRARFFIKPGVTGWAQINYQYASNVKETEIKLEHDLYYIMHRNLLLDLMIILRTAGQVFGFRGM